jgi:hypothetical protein
MKQINLTDEEADAIVRALEYARRATVTAGEQATLRQRYAGRPKNLCAKDAERVRQCADQVEVFERIIGVLTPASPKDRPALLSRPGDWLDATQKMLAG